MYFWTVAKQFKKRKTGESRFLFSSIIVGMKLDMRIQMAFYDVNLRDQLEKKQELWDINETVSFSSLVYRLKDMKKEVARHGDGLDVGLK